MLVAKFAKDGGAGGQGPHFGDVRDTLKTALDNMVRDENEICNVKTVSAFPGAVPPRALLYKDNTSPVTEIRFGFKVAKNGDNLYPMRHLAVKTANGFEKSVGRNNDAGSADTNTLKVTDIKLIERMITVWTVAKSVDESSTRDKRRIEAVMFRLRKDGDFYWVCFCGSKSSFNDLKTELGKNPGADVMQHIETNISTYNGGSKNSFKMSYQQVLLNLNVDKTSKFQENIYQVDYGSSSSKSGEYMSNIGFMSGVLYSATGGGVVQALLDGCKQLKFEMPYRLYPLKGAKLQLEDVSSRNRGVVRISQTTEQFSAKFTAKIPGVDIETGVDGTQMEQLQRDSAAGRSVKNTVEFEVDGSTTYVVDGVTTLRDQATRITVVSTADGKDTQFEVSIPAVFPGITAANVGDLVTKIIATI